MLYGAQPPRRRDARRNRAAIVQAASEAMTTQRALVGMPEIARRAGVGQATVYRHFPDRHTLTDAVIGHQVERLEECVARLRDDPAGFRPLLDEILHAQVTMRPLVLQVRRLDPAARDRHRQRIVALLAGPLRRAQEHGHVRPDLVPADLALLFTMVEGVVEDAADMAAARTAAGRSIELALDGVFRA